MIQRVVANQVPFEAIVMDDLYGRNNVLRERLDQASLEYYGDIPVNTTVHAVVKSGFSSGGMGSD